MDTNKMRSELRVSAERAIANSHPGGDGNPYPALAVRAVDVLALLAEIEHLTESRKEAREERNSIGDRHDAIEIERDQLKAENEALREMLSQASAEMMNSSRWIGPHQWAVALRQHSVKIDAAMAKGAIHD